MTTNASSSRLKPIHGFAERKEQDAARLFGHAQKQVQQEEGKLEQLRQYHLEYLARFQDAARSGMGAARMIEFRAFITKLEKAIQQQEEALALAKEQNQQAKSEWQRKQSRSKAIGKAVEHHEQREQRDQDQREQKEQDERSQHLSSIH